MSVNRWLIAFFMILTAGTLSLPSRLTNAQTDVCLGLKPADCKILTAAGRNFERFTSFQYDFDLSGSYSAGKPTGNGTFSIKGMGAFALDPGQVSDFQDQAALLGAIKMSMNITGSMSLQSKDRTSVEKIKASYILADSFVYRRDTGSARWTRTRLVDYLPSDSSSPPASIDDPELTGLMADPAVQKAMVAIPSIKGFITPKRTRNTPIVEGQRQIEFVYTFDFQALLRSKELYPILRAILKESGTDVRWSDAQLADIARQLSPSFKGTTLKVTYWIGAKDQIVHAFILDFTFRFDPRLLGMTDEAPSTATVHFAVRFTKVGREMAISVPSSEFVDEATSE
jgi:hypothetical protein